MAADNLFVRLGALFAAPRALARRDLDRRDGKAGDDLIVTALVALVLHGFASVVRAAQALGAGRVNTALHAVTLVLRPALPIVAVWLAATVLLWLFTRSQGPRRAVGELGARVATLVVLGSLVIAPIASRLDPSPLRYTVEALPWALGALGFGRVLREALEPVGDKSTPWAAPPQARLGLVALALAVLSSGALQVRAGLRHAAEQGAISARTGAEAPPIELPLLGSTERLSLRAVGDRPVVVTFWATWCGPCLQELPVLERLYRARGPEAPRVYAINVDDAGPEREAAVRAVQRRLGLTLPIALDDGAVAQAYSVTTIPTITRIEGGRIAALHDRPLDEDRLSELLR